MGERAAGIEVRVHRSSPISIEPPSAPATRPEAAPPTIGADGRIEALEGLGAPRNRAWSADEDAALRRYYGRVPTARIAAELGRTPKSARERARLIGLRVGVCRL